jgi:hypothetical protein
MWDCGVLSDPGSWPYSWLRVGAWGLVILGGLIVIGSLLRPTRP